MRTNICVECSNEFELKSDETKLSAKYCPECKAERTDTVSVLVDDGKWKSAPNGTEETGRVAAMEMAKSHASMEATIEIGVPT